MKTFGGGINHEFSEAEETCILINFDEIHEAKKSRHIDSFINEKITKIETRFPIFVENIRTDLYQKICQKRQQIQQKIDERIKAERN
jgi:hypothetical protein